MADLEFEGFQNQNQSTGVLIALIGIAVTVVFTIIFYIIGATRNSALSTENRRIEEFKSQISAQQELNSQAQGLSAGVSAFSVSLAKQVNWQSFWQQIVATQIKDIFYTNLSVDNNNSIKLDGIAPSIGSVAKQVKAIEDSPAFSNVELKKSDSENNTVKFSISFSLDTSNLKAAK